MGEARWRERAPRMFPPAPGPASSLNMRSRALGGPQSHRAALEEPRRSGAKRVRGRRAGGLPILMRRFGAVFVSVRLGLA